jgi:acetyl-CoA carboxylase biotin carboxyl carrier protein
MASNDKTGEIWMAELKVASELRANVWKIEVAVGDAVAMDQDLIILESMKTEIPVTAPKSGVVAQILVAEGDTIDERQVLLVLTV